jgi:hypothetical protein
MERDEAKAILELCRPGIQDDHNDPLIAQALTRLESDAELSAWFDEQQSVDQRICDRYHEIEPPADLKVSILAGMRAHAAGAGAGAEAIGDAAPLHPPAGSTSQAWWRNPWFAIAAGLAILLAIVVMPRQTEQTGQTQLATSEAPAHQLRADVPAVIQFLAGEIEALTSNQRDFAKRSSQPAQLQAYLASAGAPSPEALPPAIRQHPSIGCFTLEHNGIPMALICFKEERLMHLTTLPKTDCMAGLPEEPSVYELRDQAFRVWVEGDQIQILSVHGSKEMLPDFI